MIKFKTARYLPKNDEIKNPVFEISKNGAY